MRSRVWAGYKSKANPGSSRNLCWYLSRLKGQQDLDNHIDKAATKAQILRTKTCFRLFYQEIKENLTNGFFFCLIQQKKSCLPQMYHTRIVLKTGRKFRSNSASCLPKHNVGSIPRRFGCTCHDLVCTLTQSQALMGRLRSVLPSKH